MLKKVEAYTAKWNMLTQEDKVIAGVSGGADSICLLFVLLELQKKIPFQLMAVHVNHLLRGADADADEAYVKEVCRQQNIFCVTYSEDVESIAKIRKQSTEEAGREIRREVFQKAMEEYGANKIALAHHKNDNVETFFLNLARGSGLKGLGGIRPVAGDIIRPLLCVERREIEAFLKERNLSYCTDLTNREDHYTRNRIRNHVIPYLESKINARSIDHIDSVMEQLRDFQSFAQEQTEGYFKTCVTAKEEGYLVKKEEFEKIPGIFRPMLLKKVLTDLCEREKDLEAVHLDDLQKLMDNQVGRKIDLPYFMEGKRVYDGVLVRRMTEQEAEREKDLAAEITCGVGEREKLFLGDKKITCRIFEREKEGPAYPQKNNTKWFDYDIITSKVCIRTRQSGDYITIHPNGHTQKIRTFFINEKIPQSERNHILLVAEDSHILWIYGFRSNPLYEAGEHTKRILEIQIDEGENHGREN